MNTIKRKEYVYWFLQKLTLFIHRNWSSWIKQPTKKLLVNGKKRPRILLNTFWLVKYIIKTARHLAPITNNFFEYSNSSIASLKILTSWKPFLILNSYNNLFLWKGLSYWKNDRFYVSLFNNYLTNIKNVYIKY